MTPHYVAHFVVQTAQHRLHARLQWGVGRPGPRDQQNMKMVYALGVLHLHAHRIHVLPVVHRLQVLQAGTCQNLGWQIAALVVRLALQADALCCVLMQMPRTAVASPVDLLRAGGLPQ